MRSEVLKSRAKEGVKIVERRNAIGVASKLVNKNFRALYTKLENASEELVPPMRFRSS